MKRHQTLIHADALPTPAERYVQSARAARQPAGTGYRAIGTDHFALPRDRPAVAARGGTLKRNFQGYTAEDAGTLIGPGASSIRSPRRGYVRNAPDLPAYRRLAAKHGPAAVKGITLCDDDRIRAYAIERLMRDFALRFDDLREKFGKQAGRIRNSLRKRTATISCAWGRTHSKSRPAMHGHLRERDHPASASARSRVALSTATPSEAALARPASRRVPGRRTPS